MVRAFNKVHFIVNPLYDIYVHFKFIVLAIDNNARHIIIVIVARGRDRESTGITKIVIK